MARNHKHPGIVVDYFVNTTGVKISSGELVKYGDRAAIALGDIEAGATGSIQIEEVFEVPKLSSDNIAAGKQVYLDHVNKRVQLASGNDGGSPPVSFVIAGTVTAAASNGVATCLLKLNG